MNQHLSSNFVEDFLALYLVKKAPYTIPLRVREKIVVIAPWVDLVLIIAFLPILVALLGLNFVLSTSVWPIMGAHAYGWGLSTIISFVPFIFEVLAIHGLFKRKKYAWKLFMYASLLIIIENVLFFSVGGILGGVIGLYVLFQIKEYYK